MTERVRSHYTITINDCLWKVHKIYTPNVIVSSAVTLCSRVGAFQHFGGASCLHLQGRSESHLDKDKLCMKDGLCESGTGRYSFQAGPRKYTFKEDPCNGHRVKKNKPNEVHAFSIYSLLWFFQGATERNPWPIQVKIIFLFSHCWEAVWSLLPWWFNPWISLEIEGVHSSEMLATTQNKATVS